MVKSGPSFKPSLKLRFWRRADRARINQSWIKLKLWGGVRSDIKMAEMTHDEARTICREFYRYEGGDSQTRLDDGWRISVGLRQFPNEQGVGIDPDPVIARAKAWLDLKQKVWLF
jgi:hypothetical protein